MEIVLKEDVENLGEAGEVVDVADGYARNYLFPKQLAVKATEEKIEEIKKMQARQQEKEEEKRERAQKIVDNLEAEEFIFKVKAGEEGKLFGSVTSNDIAEKASGKGYDIDSRDIDLDENIKKLGVHNIPVKVYDDISAILKIKVVEVE